MIKVLFVCHGNICRSPMAEYLFKYKINKLGLDNLIYTESRATSSEEIGNPIHYKTAKILDRFNIDYKSKRAKQITSEDVLNYDYIICMDNYNIYNLERRFGNNNKFQLLLDKDIADPWYTDDFELTYKEIDKGLDLLITKLNK